jgi:hypothetical protein
VNDGVGVSQAPSGYSLAFVVRGRTLEVAVCGERPQFDVDAAHNIAQAGRTVADVVRQTQSDGMLVEIRLEGQASSTSSYRMAKSLASLGFDRGLRMAVVFGDAQTYRINLLGIRLACHDGWDIAAFRDVDKARAWLNGPRAA